jgi:ATP-binding cassette subfamily C protein
MYTKMHLRMGYAFSMDVTRHIQNLSLSYINKEDSAYLSSKIGGDTNGLIGYCIGVLQSIITNVLLLIAPLVVLLFMNWFIAVMLLLFFIAYAGIYFAFKKPLYKAGLAYKEKLDKLFSKMLEQLRYLKLIKLNSVQKEINQRADAAYEGYEGVAMHRRRVSYLYSGLDGIISTVAQIALFLVGGIMILQGEFTIGMFTIFTSYFNMMLGAGKYFFGLGAAYQGTLVSHDRIKEILGRKVEGNGGMVIQSISKIKLRGLGFSYENHGKKAIDNLDATFVKGGIYAVSGMNGAGKSTLISLIMGMYIDEYQGSITYDGTDIRNIDMESARRNLIGFAEQEPLLINDTIEFNLLFGQKGANIPKGETAQPLNEKHLNGCLKILGMESFIAENGLNFEVNEKSSNTSGGEKQKISILKVLYKNPAVMIFDEPTSALDANTAEGFISYLRTISSDKIIIVVTHDEAVKQSCTGLIAIK